MILTIGKHSDAAFSHDSVVLQCGALSTIASSYLMNTLEDMLPSSDKSELFPPLSVSAACGCFNDCVGGRRGGSLSRVSHFSAQNHQPRPLDCKRSSVGGEVEVEEKLTRPVRPVRIAWVKAAHRARR